MRFLNKLNHNLLRDLTRRFSSTASTHLPKNTPEDEAAHKESLNAFGKASFDFQYLLNLDKTQLAYKIIRLQRQVDSYVTMKSLTNVDGRDKVRVDHPDLEDLIDHYVHPYRKIAFKFLYLGWDYMAYAWSGRISDRSVKGHTNVVERVILEALLRQQLIRRIGTATSLDRSGRTDRGVSGLSQVMCFSVRSNLSEGFGVRPGFSGEEEFMEVKRKIREEKARRKLAWEEGRQDELEERNIENDFESGFTIHDRDSDHLELPYVKLLNEALPPDIRVIAWSPVSKSFSARGSCNSRTYRYFFPRGDLDIDLMHEAAQKLVGEHDFRYFSKLSVDNMTKDTVRTIKRFSIEVIQNRTDANLPGADICFATITSSGFVYRQVRLMMAILYAIGKGHCKTSYIDELFNIDEDKGRPAYSSLTGYPLMLYDTEYDDEDVDWRWDEDTLMSCADAIGSLWTEKALKTEILRTMFASIVGKIPSEDKKMEAQGYLVDALSTYDGEDLRNLNAITLSKTKTEFQERERLRTMRRLLKRGKYDHAANLYKTGETIKWKF